MYCLLPSIATDTGFARLYSEKPAFITDLPSQVFIAKVLGKEINDTSKSISLKVSTDGSWIQEVHVEGNIGKIQVK